MTPDIVVAGALASAGDLMELAHAPGDDPPVDLRYTSAEAAPGPGHYSVRVEPLQLSAALRQTERGWVATAATLNALGYGETPEAAITDLLNGIEQYLEFIRDDAPNLAPEVAHHAGYVALLDAPRGAWLASVLIDATEVE